MNDLSPRELAVILRSDLGYFAERCFYDLNPQAAFLMNWHIEVIAAKLAAVRAGKIRRLNPANIRGVDVDRSFNPP